MFRREGSRFLLFLRLLFCMVCIGMGMFLKTEAAEAVPFSLYEDGDIVGCIGDSITHATYTPLSYVEMLDQYYLSRFPEKEIEFRNLGAGGYKVGDVLNIYDQDPALGGINKAIIMLGTNEAILGYAPEEYIGSMEKLIERLKGDGLLGEDILILSPPICDQNCALNNWNGRPRWTFEDKLLEYMDELEAKADEWGVHYLDFHTSMAELTAQLQKEDAGNTLTTDCIHPNAAGQRLIAYYILRTQGAEEGPLSEIIVSGENEILTARDEVTDFYQGERGMKWTWKTETLPLAATDDVLAFRGLFDAGDILYKKTLLAEGFSEDVFYNVLMGETEIGKFTGKELESGIDFSVLEGDWQDAARQVYDLQKKRHRSAVTYRNMWIEVMMQRATYTQEQIRTEYEKWRAADQRLKEEMRAVAQEAVGGVFSMAVLEEGYSLEELEQDAALARKAAEEQARKEAQERARREAEEQARKEAEEQARKAAMEQAAEEAEDLAKKAAVEAWKAMEEQGKREDFLKWGIPGLAVGLAVLFALLLFRRRRAAGLRSGSAKKRRRYDQNSGDRGR